MIYRQTAYIPKFIMDFWNYSYTNDENIKCEDNVEIFTFLYNGKKNLDIKSELQLNRMNKYIDWIIWVNNIPYSTRFYTFNEKTFLRIEANFNEYNLTLCALEQNKLKKNDIILNYDYVNTLKHQIDISQKQSYKSKTILQCGDYIYKDEKSLKFLKKEFLNMKEDGEIVDTLNFEEWVQDFTHHFINDLMQEYDYAVKGKYILCFYQKKIIYSDEYVRGVTNLGVDICEIFSETDKYDSFKIYCDGSNIRMEALSRNSIDEPDKFLFRIVRKNAPIKEVNNIINNYSKHRRSGHLMRKYTYSLAKEMKELEIKQ